MEYEARLSYSSPRHEGRLDERTPRSQWPMTPEMHFEVLEAQQQLYPAQKTLAQIQRSLATVMAREQGEWR
jgi:hypothetical protein